MKFQLNWSSGRVSQHSQRQIRVGWVNKITGIGQGALCTLFFTLCWGIAEPSSAAERLTLRLGPFEQSVEIDDLETFAETGELPATLKPYGAVLTPQVRQVLAKRLQLDPEMTEKFIDDLLRSSDGVRLLDRISQALPNSSVEQLKAALFLAARQADGLSVLSVLRAYPEETVLVDASAAMAIALQLNLSYLQSQIVSPILEQEPTEAESLPLVSNLDPSAQGDRYIYERTLRFHDRERRRSILVDLYWTRETTGPLVVFSHGFGSDRKFLTYLAHHLASHGFTVASLEHPGSNFTWINGISLGGHFGDLLPASEFIDRPQDVSFMLDQLERINWGYSRLRGKLNTELVTVIGHSLGGYTALALAGGTLNLGQLRQFCQARSPIGRSPADWFQCAATNLSDPDVELRDPRVAQVIALNPMTGHLFGREGLEQVKVPALILTGTEDAIAPSLDHQLRSFSKLGGTKYLLSAVGGTHLSVTDPANLNEAMARSTLVKERIGEEVDPLRQLTRGVSLAFIYQLTPEAQKYKPFLTPAYARSFSTPTLSLRLNTELPSAMSTWLQVMVAGDNRVALYLPRVSPSGIISAIRSYFSPSARANTLPQVDCCAGQLNDVFNEIIEHSERRLSGLS